MKIIDLSHEFKDSTTLYPDTEKPTIENIGTVETNGSNSMRLTYTNHIGTHLDVQAHMIKDGKMIDEYELERFVGKGVVINCVGFKEINKKDLVGYIEGMDFVLIHSGYGELYNDQSYFTGYPVFTISAIEYLISEGVRGIGVDYISVDPIGSTDFKIHKPILGNDIIIYENLYNLELLLNKSFTFMGIPLKIKGDGLPVRAVALLDIDVLV